MPASPPRSWPALDVAVRGAPGAPREHESLSPPSAHDSPLMFADRVALVLDDIAPVAVDESADGARWRVYFGDRASRDAAVPALRDALGEAVDLATVDVEDEGWAHKVQEDLRAVRVGRILVAPPWDVPRAGAARAPTSAAVAAAAGGSAEPDVVLVIEPSMGFGTGHHQSTRLCLEALQTLDLRGRRVVDVGTGSGVLALASARLGAREVLAVDHDEDSVAAARDNAARNGLAGRVAIARADLASLAVEPADVVLANLTAWILRRHAGALAALVAPGGLLVASGFTHDQVPLVRDAFPGFTEESRREEDDWVGLVLAYVR